MNKPMPYSFYSIALAISVWLLCPYVQAQPDVFILNTSTGAPYTTNNQQGFQDLIVAEIFKRIGLKGEVGFYESSARALTNANDNLDQGVVMRVRGLEKKYPNLVRVDEPLIRNDFVAYSRDLDLKTDSWESLKPYTVVYINGWVIFERNLSPSQQYHTVKTPGQMFAMLEKDRVDLVLYERWQGLQNALDSGVQVVVHEPALASVNMYMYIHKDFAEVAPKIAKALREMKQDGTYQDVYDRTLKVLAK